MGVTSDVYFEVKAAIRKASQSDQYAHEIGESELATALPGLKAELQDLIGHIDEIISHDHRWNESDYCSICGADGRA